MKPCSSMMKKSIRGAQTNSIMPIIRAVAAGITSFLIWLLLLPPPPPVLALNQEGRSLVSWLSGFNSSSSSAGLFSSWNPEDQTPCNWDYIKCNDHGFVSQVIITSVYLPTTFPTQILSFEFLQVLVLSNGNLTGEIPALIGNCSSLVVLDLGFNNLTGIIPPGIGKLSGLQQLTLNSNLLQGGIPKEIGNCTKLQHIELFDNRLVGKIPVEIGQLRALEMFRAGGNVGIVGKIPGEISNCTMLRTLGLADTGITGRIPEALGALKNLRTLSIYTANLTGEIPPGLGNCSSLENLFIYQNQVSGEVPAEIGLLKNLKKMLLWQNNLTGAIPRSIGNCSSLSVIDFSLNFLAGEIPESILYITTLEGLLLSDNSVSGTIPQYIGNLSSLRQLELDTNNLSGEIPASIGILKELTLFFAWQNQLHGKIPDELAYCWKLQDLDLSNNSLTGSIPKALFNLRNLTKLLLISNKLSGEIPADIGNCSSLTRLRLGSNLLGGEIPAEIGMLESLSFLELSENQFTGKIPPEIGKCKRLEMIDLHWNRLQGVIPLSFVSLPELNVLDLSLNEISGSIPDSAGSLKSLNKLMLSGNNISGFIPESLELCQDLQFLDVSSNRLSGCIPDEIGNLQGLDILLNLSKNFLTGPIPKSFSNFSKLANMDLSHNMLVGSLEVLSNLNNLVSLNVSYNSFSGLIPDTKFFQDLPNASFAGNQKLCFSRNKCYSEVSIQSMKCARNLTILDVLAIFVALIIVISGTVFYTRARAVTCKKNDEEKGIEWDFTPFQKLDFTVEDVVAKLTDSNIVGKGCSGIVYRVETPTRQVIAVKRLWPIKRGEIPQRDLFSAEVRALGSIRHKNIVRLLGCCDNGKTRLLLFSYISNGSLSGLLHEKKVLLDWNARYNIIMGAAQGLAYLHHDCIPPIVHRDIKSNNILVGPLFEAFLADFGLAKVSSPLHTSRSPSDVIAGSYGYIAPEYGYSLKISEKSDVYSYGIVLLEVLTGMEPTDPRIPDGKHIVNWVYEELRSNQRDFTSILDQQLLLQSGTQTQEMLQMLGIALLCVSPSPNDRPTMRDVVAMLEGIKHDQMEEFEKPKHSIKAEVTFSSNTRAAFQCSSFSRSTKPLVRSPPHSLVVVKIDPI